MNVVMKNSCRQCGIDFDISQADLAFYDRAAPSINRARYRIPPPTLCPQCRMQRRMAFRNERRFYKRQCDRTGQEIISVFSPESGYTVYGHEAWWSDMWDGNEYAREFDFNRSFFQQFNDLLHAVPHPSLITTASENSRYTHMATFNKNCYLLICGSNNEACYYCYWMQHCVNCIDCYGLLRCELCYESVDLTDCYALFYSQNCRNCRHSWLLRDCVGCKYCIGCVNLRHKSFYWLNQPLSKDEFIKRFSLFRNDPGYRADLYRSFQNLNVELPRPWANQQLSEECFGDYITESSHCHECFDIKLCENCCYVQNGFELKSSYDVTFFGFPGELLYECNNIGKGAYHNLFCSYGYGSKDVMYCYNVNFSENCFGCVGLRNKQYCVLNKQCTREEYEDLVPRIIAGMRERAEWGEFFPMTLSPFAYNETAAYHYFPLEKYEVMQRGLGWMEAVDSAFLSGRIGYDCDFSEDVSFVYYEGEIQTNDCVVSGRSFRILPQEMVFYRSHFLPVPRVHPDIRHSRRFFLRNPRRLWERTCVNCSVSIQTSFVPERKEKVYCEKCYLASVY